jgi:hypothetical protein
MYAANLRTVAPSNYFDIDKDNRDRMKPVLFEAKALYACRCLSSRLGTV